jgi:hypothetical protein
LCLLCLVFTVFVFLVYSVYCVCVYGVYCIYNSLLCLMFIVLTEGWFLITWVRTIWRSCADIMCEVMCAFLGVCANDMCEVMCDTM